MIAFDTNMDSSTQLDQLERGLFRSLRDHLEAEILHLETLQSALFAIAVARLNVN